MGNQNRSASAVNENFYKPSNNIFFEFKFQLPQHQLIRITVAIEGGCLPKGSDPRTVIQLRCRVSAGTAFRSGFSANPAVDCSSNLPAGTVRGGGSDGAAMIGGIQEFSDLASASDSIRNPACRFLRKPVSWL